MNKVFDYLEQLDLSEIEAKLYIMLLETGPISVRELAHTTGIKRTTAYLYIDQLIEKGLIMKMVKGSRTQIAANSPEASLEYLVEKKMQNAKTIQTELPEVLEKIKITFPTFKEVGEAEIKYYKGISNARKIYKEALCSDELRSYVKIKETEKLFPDNLPVFEEAFQNNKKLKVWEIIYDFIPTTKDAERVESVSSDRYFYKFLPKSLKLSSEDILIYDGKVAIINYRSGNTSVVLQSSDFYNNLKELFDFIWNILSDPKENYKQ